MDPRKAAASIVKGIERRVKRIIVGADVHFLDLPQRLVLPARTLACCHAIEVATNEKCGSQTLILSD